MHYKTPYKTMHMERFDMTFTPGSAARKENITRLQNDYERQIGRVQNFTTQQSISSPISFRGDFRKFQSIAAITDLLNRHLTVGPQEVWTKQVRKVDDVSDVSICSCAIYLRRSKWQDLSTSGEKRVDLHPRNFPIWLNWWAIQHALGLQQSAAHQE